MNWITLEGTATWRNDCIVHKIQAYSSSIFLQVSVFCPALLILTNNESNRESYLYIECVHCHALKNKIKNYAMDKVKIVIL